MQITWPPNLPQRVESDGHGDERQSLEEWVDYHRLTLLYKCEGLTEEQLKMRSAEPSTLTLLGLVRHMTEVEIGWFQRHAGGEDVTFPYSTDEDPDADLLNIDDADASADLA